MPDTVIMWSSLSSIIWGESSHDQATPAPPTTTIDWRDDSHDEDDWMVVGRVAQFPGTLAGTFPLPPPSTRSGSPSSSPALSIVGDDVREERLYLSNSAPVSLNTQRGENTGAAVNILGNTEQKHFRSAQLAKKRYMRKKSSRKMLKRSNKPWLLADPARLGDKLL